MTLEMLVRSHPSVSTWRHLCVAVKSERHETVSAARARGLDALKTREAFEARILDDAGIIVEHWLKDTANGRPVRAHAHGLRGDPSHLVPYSAAKQAATPRGGK